MSEAHRNALVLFSGGQDSATCLAYALTRYERVETIGFDYGQRHRVELTQRLAVLAALRQRFAAWSGRLGEDHVLDLPVLGQISDTAMTRDIAIETQAGGMPNTFVPGRNLLFLTLAVTLGMDRRYVIDTPLMWLDKAATWQLAHDLGQQADPAGGGADLVRLITEHTHTCYLGDRTHSHPWGWGCGHCPACELRARGWAKYSQPRSSS